MALTQARTDPQTAIRIYGCTYNEAREANGGRSLDDKTGKALRYKDQRYSALKRGIAWEITFPEWARLWDESGKWELRGVGLDKFCMARNGDTGPYKVGNVRIALNIENWREAGPVKARANHANPKGYSRVCKNPNKPFLARLGQRVLGHFATEEEAHAAYLAAKGGN